MKSLKSDLALFFSFAGIFVILINSKNVSLGAISGLNLAATVLIPSLFPFCVISLFLVNSGGFYKLNKLIGLKGAVYILSGLGGYPSGSIIISELYNKKFIDKNTAEKLMCFGVNSGPLFIIYAVGTTFYKSTKIGVILLLAHLLSSFIIMLFIKCKNSCSLNKEQYSITGSFFNSLSSSCDSFLKITGTVVLSSALFYCCKNIKYAKYLLAFLEVTVGVKENINNIYFCIFLLGFSGFSVILQILYFCQKIKINILKLIFFRCLHGLLSVIILKIYFWFFPFGLTTISNGPDIFFKEYYISAPSALSIFIMCVMFIIYINRKIS